jgi:hypothetical protein
MKRAPENKRDFLRKNNGKVKNQKRDKRRRVKGALDKMVSSLRGVSSDEIDLDALDEEDLYTE